MASPTQLVEVMSQTLGITDATCENTWKELRSNNLVVNAGKGGRGAQVGPADCAVFLIALLGADSVKDSVAVAQHYSTLFSRDPWPKEIASMLGKKLARHHTLGDALTAIFESYRDQDPKIEAVIVTPSGRKQKAMVAPTVQVIVSAPIPNATIDVGWGGPHRLLYMSGSVADMFPQFDSGASKRRISKTGDLLVSKRVTHKTLEAIGHLLRDAVIDRRD